MEGSIGIKVAKTGKLMVRTTHQHAEEVIYKVA